MNKQDAARTAGTVDQGLSMNRIKMSIEGRCAQVKYVFPMQGKKEMRKQWVDTHDLFTDKDGRVFALVDTPTKVYFMDAITGSLYDFGVCLTSDTLKMHGLKRDHDYASEYLLSKKADDPSPEDSL